VVAAFVAVGTDAILWSLLLLLLGLLPFYGHCFFCCWDCCHFVVAAFVAAGTAAILWSLLLLLLLPLLYMLLHK